MTTKKTTSPGHYTSPVEDEVTYGAADVGSVPPPGPCLGVIEYEVITREAEPLYASVNGGTVGQTVDAFFEKLVLQGAEVREFKLVFEDAGQFDRLIRTTIYELLSRGDGTKIHPRYRDLADGIAGGGRH